MLIGSRWQRVFRTLSGNLQRDDFSSNRHLALSYWWSMIFFRKPVSTFRDHALIPQRAAVLARIGAADQHAAPGVDADRLRAAPGQRRDDGIVAARDQAVDARGRQPALDQG